MRRQRATDSVLFYGVDVSPRTPLDGGQRDHAEYDASKSGAVIRRAVVAENCVDRRKLRSVGAGDGRHRARSASDTQFCPPDFTVGAGDAGWTRRTVANEGGGRDMK